MTHQFTLSTKQKTLLNSQLEEARRLKEQLEQVNKITTNLVELFCDFYQIPSDATLSYDEATGVLSADLPEQPEKAAPVDPPAPTKAPRDIPDPWA